MKRDLPEWKRLASIDYARKYILDQQRTRIIPVPAALYSVESMFRDDIIGRYKAHDVELLSLARMDFGMGGEFKESMLTFCRRNWCDIPSDRLFDCRWIHRYDYLHCGQNCDKFSQVWHHPNMPDLLTKVLRSYRQHIADSAPDENYRAVFYCMYGYHESVATVLGLVTMFLANYDIEATCWHRSGARSWRPKRNTRLQCCNITLDDRKEWELELIESILKKVSLY